MHALRNLAASTLGELKDALIDDAAEDEESDGQASPRLAAPSSTAFRPDGGRPVLNGFAVTPGSTASPPPWKPLHSSHLLFVPPGPGASPSAPSSAPPSAPSSVRSDLRSDSLSVASAPAATAWSMSPAAAAEAAARGSPQEQREEQRAKAAREQKAAEEAAKLEEEAAEARRRFVGLLALPGMAKFLGREAPLETAETAEGLCVFSEAPSVARIASECAGALRDHAPRLLLEEAAEPSDKQRLLASFGDRYDTLLAQCDASQRRCRELVWQNEAAERAAQEAGAWQAAQRAATQRVEDLAHENAELKERLRRFEFEARGRGPEQGEQRRLQQLLAQREAEVAAAGAALQQLQDVMEDSTGADGQRRAQLEAELQEARRELAAQRAAQDAGAAGAAEALEAAAAASRREQESVARCQAAEQELRETGAALEALLEEKGRFLEEREHLVDRRMVTSAVSLGLEHLAAHRQTLAQQVLSQALQILGGLQEELAAERRGLREAAAAAESRRSETEPLGDAFLDFLTRELSERSLDEPPVAPAAAQATALPLAATAAAAPAPAAPAPAAPAAAPAGPGVRQGP